MNPDGLIFWRQCFRDYYYIPYVSTKSLYTVYNSLVVDRTTMDQWINRREVEDIENIVTGHNAHGNIVGIVLEYLANDIPEYRGSYAYATAAVITLILAESSLLLIFWESVD